MYIRINIYGTCLQRWLDGSFKVIGLVVVVPWSGLRDLQTSAH